MQTVEVLGEQLERLPGLAVREGEPLGCHTRFQIGGPARLFCECNDAAEFAPAWRAALRSSQPCLAMGDGTNLVVSDQGFDGVVLRLRGTGLNRRGAKLIVDAGVALQAVVDYAIEAGLAGCETLTGIPGSVGGAVYGNAGAYGRSMHELVETVRYCDAEGLHTITGAECGFGYRESEFKHRKERVILEAELRLSEGDRSALRKKAHEIRTVRDAKYPPSMRCAGSIFKNVFLSNLPGEVQAQVPPTLVRDGKIPSAWFLEQAGVKGMRRGDIQVAEYHANLIYNDGQGTATDLIALIGRCKQLVRERFGFALEEEVQYVGFGEELHAAMMA